MGRSGAHVADLLLEGERKEQLRHWDAGSLRRRGGLLGDRRPQGPVRRRGGPQGVRRHRRAGDSGGRRHGGDGEDRGPPVTPPRFTADRPLVFLIRANRSGSVLFVGLADPTKG